jgi:hypothetical protein
MAVVGCALPGDVSLARYNFGEERSLGTLTVTFFRFFVIL